MLNNTFYINVIYNFYRLYLYFYCPEKSLSFPVTYSFILVTAGVRNLYGATSPWLERMVSYRRSRYITRRSVLIWTISTPAAMQDFISSSVLPDAPWSTRGKPVIPAISLTRSGCRRGSAAFLSMPCTLPTAGAKQSTPVLPTNSFASATVVRFSIVTPSGRESSCLLEEPM